MTPETKIIDSVIGARNRSRQNSTATVVTGDIVEETTEEAEAESEE